jgi:hypothetical protein
MFPNPPEPHSRIDVKVEIHNFGNTPARITRVQHFGHRHFMYKDGLPALPKPDHVWSKGDPIGQSLIEGRNHQVRELELAPLGEDG